MTRLNIFVDEELLHDDKVEQFFHLFERRLRRMGIDLAWSMKAGEIQVMITRDDT